jgi:RNA-directed DNA polymerase
LYVNKAKTRLLTKPGQRIVTGISVSGDKLRLPRDTRRELKKEIYYICKYGFLSHASKIKIRNPLYFDSLYGKFQFWLQIEPKSVMAQNAIMKLEEIRTATQ